MAGPDDWRPLVQDAETWTAVGGPGAKREKTRPEPQEQGPGVAFGARWDVRSRGADGTSRGIDGRLVVRAPASLTLGMCVLACRRGQRIEGANQPSPWVALGGAHLFCRDTARAWRILLGNP